jgi:hypothetical protein
VRARAFAEPGLAELIAEGVGDGTLTFTTNRDGLAEASSSC